MNAEEIYSGPVSEAVVQNAFEKTQVEIRFVPPVRHFRMAVEGV